MTVEVKMIRAEGSGSTKVGGRARTIRERRRFSKIELEILAKSRAKYEIVGAMYRGEFERQECIWTPEGDLDVFTTHTPEPQP